MGLPRLILPLAILSLLASAGAAAAQDVPDTEANRRQAAEQYLEVQPVEEMMQGMVSKMAAQMPEDRQAEMRRIMEEVRYDTLETAMVDAVVRHFTVSEIKALTRFYSTPEGRSIMEKMSAYMADVQPLIMEEVRRAIQNSMESNEERR